MSVCMYLCVCNLSTSHAIYHIIFATTVQIQELEVTHSLKRVRHYTYFDPRVVHGTCTTHSMGAVSPNYKQQGQAIRANTFHSKTE